MVLGSTPRRESEWARYSVSTRTHARTYRVTPYQVPPIPQMGVVCKSWVAGIKPGPLF